MAAPKKITEPHKELRFTRAGQAQGFIVIAAVSFAFFPPDWPHLVHGTPHLYLVDGSPLSHSSRPYWPDSPPTAPGTPTSSLTPLGMEIFPLIKPHKNLNLVYWAQIVDADFDEDLTALKLHFNEDQTAGIILSLKAISAKKRLLLKRALESRLAEKKG